MNASLPAVFALCASGILLGCGDNQPPNETTHDSGNGETIDAAIDSGFTGDAAAPLAWVDFAVSGCESGDGSEASPCIGTSPLQLRFTLLAPSTIDNQLWNFGDQGDENSELSPVHRFDAPGSYDLSLNVEGPGGTAGVTKLAAVVVIPAPLSGACTQDDYCASGDCSCDNLSDCPPLLSGGMCYLECFSHVACGSNRCVDLNPTGVAQTDWQRQTCLPPCAPDQMVTGCDSDKTCQALLGIDGQLTPVCFPPGLLLPIGASCASANGELSHESCASGLCLDFGDHGVCSAECQKNPCPSGSACATFGTGPSPHCLANCQSTTCLGDPSLSCQVPGTDFTVDEAPNPSGYCSLNAM